MIKATVKTLYSEDQSERLEVVWRDDGAFQMILSARAKTLDGLPAWSPLMESGIYQSLDLAEAEIASFTGWSKIDC